MDVNSQPNGRQNGSYSAQYYFLPKFTRIDPPKNGEPNYGEKERSSLLSEFNRAQREQGKPEVKSGSTVRDWLKNHRPKHALCPHMTDYCDTCKELGVQLKSLKATRKRLVESGNAQSSEIQEIETKVMNTEAHKKMHKEDAFKAREFHHKMIERCKSVWKEITELEEKSSLSQTDADKLNALKHQFTLVISADYQQAKLVPHWGRTAQPGQTYYFQKISHDIFGIVDHRIDQNSIYLFDKTIGPKNTDHTISFLESYLQSVRLAYPWINRVCIFLDNACSTNKNRYLFAWCIEMVSSNKIDHIHVSFMVAGHTKFAPDRLFSAVAHTYNTSDVFNISELKAVCLRHASTHVEDGSGVFHWRELLHSKYTELPGIRFYHDFLTVKTPSGATVMKIREKCYEGTLTNSPLRIKKGFNSQIVP